MSAFSILAFAEADLSISRELEFRRRDTRALFDLVSTPSGTLAELLDVPGAVEYLATKFRTTDRNFLAQLRFETLSIEVKFDIANLIIRDQIQKSSGLLSYEQPLHINPLTIKSHLAVSLAPGEVIHFQGVTYSNPSGSQIRTVQIPLHNLFRTTVERLNSSQPIETEALELHVYGSTVANLVEDTSIFFDEIFPRRAGGVTTSQTHEPTSDHFHFVADSRIFYENTVARLRTLFPAIRNSANREAEVFALASTLWIFDLELARTYTDFSDHQIPATQTRFEDQPGAGRSLDWLTSPEIDPNSNRRIVFDWMEASDLSLIFNFFKDFQSPTLFSRKMDPETRAKIKQNLNGVRKGIFRDGNLFSIEGRLLGFLKNLSYANSKTRVYLAGLHSVMTRSQLPDHYISTAQKLWNEARPFTSPMEMVKGIWIRSDLAAMKRYYSSTAPNSMYHGPQARQYQRLVTHLLNSEEFKDVEKSYNAKLKSEKLVNYPTAYFLLVPWADHPSIHSYPEVRQRVFNLQLRALSAAINEYGEVMQQETLTYANALKTLMGELAMIQLSKGQLDSADINEVFNQAPLQRLQSLQVNTSAVGIQGRVRSLVNSCTSVFNQ